MGANAKICADGVERWFTAIGRPVTRALGPLDLQVADGEFVSIVGPSGCGKSTFLRMLAGLVDPSAGRLDLLHRDVRRPLTATVFQDYSIFPWKTVEANVRFGLQMRKRRGPSAEESVDLWVARLGLSHCRHAYPHTLSGGMKQRVSIARAFAVDSEILLMDEPFAALDAQLRTILQEELLRIWQENQRTVIFITHSIDEAILLSDRIVVMSAGPGTILREFVVPLERPRTLLVRQLQEFTELEGLIWDVLREQVDVHVAGSPS